MSVRLFVAETVAVRSPRWLYRRLPDRLRLWCADVRVLALLARNDVVRGPW